jgi:hypothetical protein
VIGQFGEKLKSRIKHPDIVKHCRKGEVFLSSTICAILYASCMFGTFFFFEFDMFNRLCREYFGLVPYFGVPYFPIAAFEFFGIGFLFGTLALIHSTILLFICSGTAWLTLMTPSETEYVFKRIPVGKNEKSCVIQMKVIERHPTIAFHTAVKVYIKLLLIAKFGQYALQRICITLHHSAMQMMMCLFTYSYIRHFENMTLATLIAFPVAVTFMALFEYFEVIWLSELAEMSSKFIEKMKRGYDSGKYERRVLNSIRPMKMSTYYPARSVEKSNFTHFLRVYSLNTTDLLLAF